MVSADILYNINFILCMRDEHMDDVLLQTHSLIHIHKHSNFLICTIYVGFASARPNYCIIILFLHDYVGQDKPLTLDEMIKIAQSYEQHQCKFIISARKSHHL